MEIYPISIPRHSERRKHPQVPVETTSEMRKTLERMHVKKKIQCWNYWNPHGKLHGPTGNLGQKWWSLESKRRFQEREACYVEHYGRLTGSKDEDEARTSLYENIADNVGLNVAFKAWKAHGDQRFRKLAGLSLNDRQLFFLGYAQGWCALKSNRQRGVHMLEEKRVTGALQNSAEFANAFSCPLDSPMNPQHNLLYDQLICVRYRCQSMYTLLDHEDGIGFEDPSCTDNLDTQLYNLHRPTTKCLRTNSFCQQFTLIQRNLYSLPTISN
ncbi:hypothetical protein KIN20_030244 [Parelaphostrongylus tenuis]|uniref:Peptidase M13 C-terminal domain-containing protein n=1 Tax=Parelaphostrongylus tenuis TaxID=148309 RepID=A0AAD5R3H0_PARTN|nr:hypothetical protein KIN20_030244 [Parelaphostrongylus tenuis]